MNRGLTDQLIALVQRAYPGLHTDEEIRQHLHDVFERRTYFIEVEGEDVGGYVEWSYPSQTMSQIRVTELLVTKPAIIWKLKRRFFSLPWTQIAFKRHKLFRERSYQRRLSHV